MQNQKSVFAKISAVLLVISLTACGNNVTFSPKPTPPPPTATLTPVPPTATLSTVLAAGFPPQPEGVPFPTESWPEGEWPSGVDRAVVDEAVDLAFAEGRG